MYYTRQKLEEIEQMTLAPYALKSSESLGRIHSESPTATRTTFQRDRDRIIHTTAFRQLEYKTQVFIFYEGDYYRTRLTHTLEVAQIGRALARGLGVNQDLTEAICLAHDLGHSPFGHAGEYALNKLMVNFGGYNHNVQSYRIVTKLETRYPDFQGLNLCYETREGMIKHETDYDHSENHEYAPLKRASLEAQLANFADEVAYNAHDLDDGLRAGMFDLDKLDQLDIWQRLRKQIDWASGPLTALRRHHLIRELIGLSVTDLVTTTYNRITQAQLTSPESIQTYHENLVSYSPQIGPEVKALKAFLYKNMYKHYRLVRMQEKGERFISDMFNAYLKTPAMLPTETQKELAHRSKERVITDYIAAMTDRYALDEWERLFTPYERP